ncbi:glycosyltransferase [Peribacillus sp. FSL H8-0477]|uniref:glycosyltransferase n=1 Tax=Peribacillus sp. FSL H8-0477 TaxID=2921388 RepID=UPI0030FCB1A5
MKKDILISVYNMEIGGIERSLINMLESFDYERFNIDLLVLHHTGEFFKLIPDKVNILPEISSYSVFRKPIRQSIKEGHYFSSIIRILSKITANLKSKSRMLKEGSGYIQMQLTMKYSQITLPKLKKKYDIAISYAWPHDIVINKVDANKKIAWIHTDYNTLEIDNKLDLKMWRNFDHIAAVSEECLNSFLSQYPSLKDRALIIENITSPQFIRKMANETEINSQNQKTFNILSVGRLSYAKGFDLAVYALRLLHNKGYTNLKWSIVGYGGYESELKELINENNLEDHFILLGKQTNPYPYIKSCDLYVQPSRYEGKAVTVGEAQILAKPVLITNYPTAKSQISNHLDGLICELSVEGIADGIEKLYMDKELRIHLSRYCQGIDYHNDWELNKLYQLV